VDIPLDKFKMGEPLANAVNEALATAAKAVISIPFLKEFQIGPNYEVNQDGSVSQKENHFD